MKKQEEKIRKMFGDNTFNHIHFDVLNVSREVALTRLRKLITSANVNTFSGDAEFYDVYENSVREVVLWGDSTTEAIIENCRNGFVVCDCVEDFFTSWTGDHNYVKWDNYEDEEFCDDYTVGVWVCPEWSEAVSDRKREIEEGR